MSKVRISAMEAKKSAPVGKIGVQRPIPSIGGAIGPVKSIAKKPLLPRTPPKKVITPKSGSKSIIKKR
jgi:hypothetical protein